MPAVKKDEALVGKYDFSYDGVEGHVVCCQNNGFIAVQIRVSHSTTVPALIFILFRFRNMLSCGLDVFFDQ